MGQKDKQITENVDEVDEKVNRVPDVVLVAKAALSNDQLGVVENEATYNGKSDIQVHLEDEEGSNEEVGKEQHAQH